MGQSAVTDRPLSGLRVIDLTDGKAEMCGRYLADLGAEVIMVEPPGGAGSRSLPPFAGQHSLYFATHNANKRSVVLDLRAVMASIPDALLAVFWPRGAKPDSEEGNETMAREVASALRERYGVDTPLLAFDYERLWAGEDPFVAVG